MPVQEIVTWSTNAVLSPPRGFRPRVSTVCIPAETVKFAVW